ncbi:unnamed protein product [Caenorhabditis angaria]|uniref:Innexin n=1 Tax=Caenorhabditis angaria TaxID=860376 RepID=A0A9P1I5P5_9PELO|nr:unnamed protein product [Caenorhabditis angaria]
MLKNIEGYASTIKSLSKHDDDSIDRLNYVTTTSIIIALATLLFAKSYVGEPMQCWVPTQFKNGWESFTEQYCFIENTYFVPMNETNLPAANTREDREMIYYQWVPFILIIMALCFCIPRAFWIIFPSYSGLTIADIIKAARTSGKKLEEAQDAIDIYAKQVNIRTDEPQTRTSGSHIFNYYIAMKALILLNVTLQFFFLNRFLNTSYTLWGWGIFWDMIHGRHWQESGHFPRVSFCDINVRELGNINHWTVQCVLMVNMFNEKIFIFLWFWFAFLLIVTSGNFIMWTWRRFVSGSQLQFVSDLLYHGNIESTPEQEKSLIKNVLKHDGRSTSFRNVDGKNLETFDWRFYNFNTIFTNSIVVYCILLKTNRVYELFFFFMRTNDNKSFSEFSFDFMNG